MPSGGVQGLKYGGLISKTRPFSPRCVWAVLLRLLLVIDTKALSVITAPPSQFLQRVTVVLSGFTTGAARAGAAVKCLWANIASVICRYHPSNSGRRSTNFLVMIWI